MPIVRRTLLLGCAIIGASFSGCTNDPFMPTPVPEPAWSLVTTGEPFVDVWGSSSAEVFVLGSAGTLLRYDGTGWDEFPAPPSSGGAIWGTGPDDMVLAAHQELRGAVWSLGSIYHYDGLTWDLMYAGHYGRIQDIWGTSKDDLYVVGYDGSSGRAVILHFDGSTWTKTRTEVPDIAAVWGSSSSDVFAVGASATRYPSDPAGAILHYDGSTWTQMSFQPPSALRDIWGSSSADLYAAGDDGVFHYDGTTWSLVKPFPAYALWGASSTDVYAAGAEGTILHYDGTSWTELKTQGAAGSPGLYAVWGSSGQNVFMVGGGDRDHSSPGSFILHYDGIEWRPQSSPLLQESWTKLAGVGGSSAAEVLFVGEAQGGYPSIRVFDGARFTEHIVDASNPGGWSDVWAATPEVSFLVGKQGYVGVYDKSGFTYTWLAAGDEPSVWASSPTDAIIVGDPGTIHHYDGSAWTSMPSGTTNGLLDIWGALGTDVFAVGRFGAICHFDGSEWRLMSTQTDSDLRSVWGSSGRDVFAVGDGGTILHYDGAAWSHMANPMPADLRGVWGNSGIDVFAIGPGVMLHYDGRSWTLESNMLGGDKIWGHAGGDVYVIDELRVFRYRPEQPATRRM